MDFHSRTRLAVRLATVFLLAFGVSQGTARAQSPESSHASEIARQALDAVRQNWALARYDEARQVRVAINLRGAGSQGVTANLVVDRGSPRWRLDAAGGVGPLTVWATADRVALHVPSLKQYATRAGGELARHAGDAGGLDAEVAAMQARLEGGYTALSLGGEETIDGAGTWRLNDQPEPGTTVSYWIDRRTHLPRRIVLDRPGRRDVRVELAYSSGARPSGATVYLQGQRDVEIRLTPTYERSGRVSRVQIITRPAGGTSITTDVTLDWSPVTGAGFFQFTPPAGASEVPFGQLSQGVLLMAAGALGGLLPVFLGAS